MEAAKRAALIAKLTPMIEALMAVQPDMRHEAIVEGRVGLNEMDDADLSSFAADCYEVDVDDMCDKCGAPNNDGEGENGLCGNCADATYDENGNRKKGAGDA